jgi:hypothetical protein
MAIRRCPYCKAIIDEQDKYCNNCGTQLLFPEDEFVEEEIPGDKIVDEEETKEEEQEEELEEEEKPEKMESVEEKVEEDEEEEEIEEKEEGEDKDDDSEELEEPVEEKEEDKEEAEEVLEPEAEEGAEEEGEEDLEEEIEEPAEEIRTGEPIGKAALVDEPHKKYKVSIEEDELVFRTKELDNLTGTVDEGKEKLEELLSSFQKKKEKAVTPHEVPALFQEGEEPTSTTKELLPPWARGMKEEPPQSADLGEREKTETSGAIKSERTPTRPEWTTDSGIGIPEKVTQAALPFGTAAVPATAEEKEAVAEEEEKQQAGADTRQGAGFSLKLKSKLVDLVFITALWIITLWFTAQVIGVSFLRVIVGSPVPVLAFYFILLLLYFFLFLYFLGETLGDHYFSEED